ncbi:hypothetical protein SAMN04515617_12523 [Collimonas sp. OK242]|jgi:uncharacterized lipoprotein YmbA|uniref:PqiC family protein n=1 Tax=Collimonas sp. OK242 TaxID=1798195 RepID=UPI000897A3A0|nr:PqiC family protein [Collimonas sp. OK242]SDY85594.1 hypothetical protein SAMN04515617_12523 [Collimonas sp. OK242]
MISPARLACIAALAFLSACADAPPTRLVTLDDGRPKIAGVSNAPSIAVVRANVPERIDRSQLVMRTGGNQVTLSEQYRWAEPLRREIPRVMANDLGELLDSSRIAALPSDAAGYDVDFKLMLDFQQLDAVAGQGVDVDVLWRVEHRSGSAIVGRSSFRQPVAGTAADYPTLVAAQRQAMRRVATEIAQDIAAYQRR